MAVEKKYRLSILVDETSGIPALVVAKEVEYDGGWNAKTGGEIYTLTKGSEFATNIYWYSTDIEHTGHYSIYINSIAQEGYVGKFLDIGNTSAAVTGNTAHRLIVSGNPHSVSKADVGLDNVENYTPSEQVAEGLTKELVIATGLDLGDLPDTAAKYAENADLIVEKDKITALQSSVSEIESNLTITNLVAAIRSDDAVLEALCAILQNSNLLASKIAAAMAE